MATPPVRLRPEEIAAVKHIVAKHFGAEAELQVFGSRADPTKRGGDLDLQLCLMGPKPGWRVESRCVGAIEQALEDRHTDLLVLGSDETPRRIDKVAIATGVLL